MSGYLDILNHETLDAPLSPPEGLGAAGGTTTTIESDQIWHDGQIIAVVLAESFEAAREAAHKVRVRYESEPPTATFGCPGAQSEPHKPPIGPDPQVGDMERAFESAEVKIEARYATPRPASQTRSSCSPPPASGTAPTSPSMNPANSCGG